MKNLEKCKCENTAVYDLFRTGMVDGPAQVFTRYHEKDITRIRSHVYKEESKLTKGFIGYDANSYIFTAPVMKCPVAKTRWL